MTLPRTAKRSHDLKQARRQESGTLVVENVERATSCYRLRLLPVPTGRGTSHTREKIMLAMRAKGPFHSA